MQRAFSFPEPPAETGPPKPHILMINDESFNLATDVEGAELLALAGRANNANGTHILLSRAIRDEDWERFTKATRFCKLTDFGKIAGAVIDLYADFPTTVAADS